MRPIERLRWLGSSGPHVIANAKPSVKVDGPVLLSATKEDVLGRHLMPDSKAYRPFRLAMSFHPDAPDWLKEYRENLFGFHVSPPVWELSDFLGFVKEFRGFGRSVRRFVSSWYFVHERRTLSTDLEYEAQGDRSWRHRDILRMCHVKAAEEDTNWLFGYIVGRPDFSSDHADPILHAIHVVKTNGAPLEILEELVTRYRVPENVWPKELAARVRNPRRFPRAGGLQAPRDEADDLQHQIDMGKVKPSNVVEFLNARGYLQEYPRLRLLDALKMLLVAGKKSRALAEAFEDTLPKLMAQWPNLSKKKKSALGAATSNELFGVHSLVGADDRTLAHGLPNISKRALAALILTEARSSGAQQIGASRRTNLIVVDVLTKEILLREETRGVPTIFISLGRSPTDTELPEGITEIHGYSSDIHRFIGSYSSSVGGNQFVLEEAKRPPKMKKAKFVTGF